MKAHAASIAHRILGATVLAAVVVVFVRCGSSDAASSFTGPGGGVPDSGKNDSDAELQAPDASTGSALPRVLAVMHAADTFDFRVCFATSSTADGATLDVLDGNPLPDDPQHPMPQANYPGIGRGNGAIVAPNLPSGPGFVIPILIDALALTTHAGEDCKKLLACSGTACIKASERAKLPGLSGNDLSGGGTFLLAVRGSGATLAMTAIRASGAPSSGSNLGGQLAHLAPTLPRLAATYGAADGGVSLGTATFGTVGPQKVTLPRPDDANGMDLYGSRGVALSLAPADAGADASTNAPPFFFSSLAEIQQASDPSLPPNELFKAGASYLFVVTGDPNVPKTVDGGANPDFPSRGLHVIALPASAR
jgi:hypothetical protein